MVVNQEIHTSFAVNTYLFYVCIQVSSTPYTPISTRGYLHYYNFHCYDFS